MIRYYKMDHYGGLSYIKLSFEDEISFLERVHVLSKSILSGIRKDFSLDFKSMIRKGFEDGTLIEIKESEYLELMRLYNLTMKVQELIILFNTKYNFK